MKEQLSPGGKISKNKKCGISPAVATLTEMLKTEGLLPSIKEPTNISSLIHTKIYILFLERLLYF